MLPKSEIAGELRAAVAIMSDAEKKYQNAMTKLQQQKHNAAIDTASYSR
jgi:hypothetical protein